MMEEEIDKMNSNDSMFMNMTNETTFNCSSCENEFCLAPEDYEYYLSFVKVDDFEMVFVILNVIVFLTGIMGNLLVSMTDILIYIHRERHQRGARAQARKDPYNGGAPPPPSIFQNQGKTWVLPVLPHMAPLV